MVHQEQISLSTKSNGDMHDLTAQIEQVVKSSGIQTGIAHIFNIGSTGAIGLLLLFMASKIIPIFHSWVVLNGKRVRGKGERLMSDSLSP